MEELERRNLLAVVATDLPDYAPGSTAQIFASSFQLGEAVQFQVLHSDGMPNTGDGHLPWTVIDGSSADLDGKVDGNIHTTWYVDPDDSNGATFNLSAQGMNSGQLATTTFTDLGSTLSQFANKPTTNYQTGSLNSSNSAYVEGNSIPFRYLVSDLREDASVVLDVIYQFQSSAAGPRTYDYLTSDTSSEAITDTQRFGPNNASIPSGFGLTSSTNLVTAAIPDDSSITTDTGGNFRIASNVPVTVMSVSAPAISSSPDEKHITLVIKLGNDGDATPNENIVDLGVFWGGHLARDTDYAGTNNGAADAPGASFHMRAEGFQDLNNNGNKDNGEDSLGGGDRSIQGGVVVHTTLAWEKRSADTSALQGGATFTVTPNPFTGSGSLTVVDDTDGVTSAGDIDHDPSPGSFLLEDILFGNYTIAETVAPAGFDIDADPTRLQSVTTADPNAVVGTQGQNDAGTTDESDFHDPRQVGSIAWEKRTDAGTLLGGATFTITPDPSTGAGSLVVVDDTDGVTSPGDVDQDPSPGQFLVNNVLLGTYTVTETAAPAGYLLDDVVSRTVTVSSQNRNAVIGAQGVFDTGNTNSSDFIDPAVNASIAINKVTVDGATSGDGSTILSGEAISWQYTVTNTGNVPLANVSVTDNQLGVTPLYQTGDVNNNGLLDLTESWTYTASGTAIVGSYSNTGTAKGSFADSAGHVNNAMASDPSSYFGAAPQIAINKVTVDGATSGDGLTILSGEPISWRYTVTNAGNVALANVVVTDNQAGVTPVYQNGDTNSNSLLDLTETWTYTASSTAITGSYSNTGTAKGSITDTAGHTSTAMASDPSSYFGAAPQIAINKVTIDGATFGDGITVGAGDGISWRYTVANPGNVALSGVTVTDNQPGVTPVYQTGDVNNNGLLDLTETWTYTASGTAIAGSYNNTGTAKGGFTDSAGHTSTAMASDPSSYFGAAPQIAINKVTVDGAISGDGLTILSGEPIAWRYTVTNTGNVALASVAVMDNQAGVTPAYQSGDVNNNSLLDLTETWTYTAGGTAITGSYGNIGTAKGNFTDSTGHTNTALATDPSTYFGAAPQIAIDKVTVDGATSGDGLNILSGEAISWRYTVTNTGNVALANVAVTDNQAGVTPAYQSGDVNNNGLLDLTETWTYTASSTAITGNYSNTGTAKGSFTDSAGHTSTAMATDPSSYFGAAPQIAINKVTVEGANVGDGITVNEGDAISWRYTVANTGNVALSNVTVTDDHAGVTPVYQTGDVNSNGLLDLTETWTYTASGTAIMGSYSNIGTAKGSFTDTAGHTRTAMASDGSSYFGQCDVIVIGPDKQNTSNSLVKVVDRKTGQIVSQFYAYEPNFQGGVRIATGDMDSDGIDEIITAPGRGRAPEIRVFTQAGVELTQFRTMAYATTYSGGVEVAVGDVNGDGKNDIVTVPSYGPTQARVFFNNYNPANPLADPISNAPNKQFSVFSNKFLGGADVVLADVGKFSNGTTISATAPDGKDEIVIGNGPGMRSTIYVYDVTGTPKIVDTILPFSNTFKGGITLDAARINADLIPDFIVSAGNGGHSAVEIWSGLTNDAVDVRLATFTTFANTPTANAPVHAVAIDTNNDGIADTIVAVQGTDGNSGQIRSFKTDGTPFSALSGFAGPWHISRLHCHLPSVTEAVDEAFTQLGNS
jgi:uncharacterized repeat protein (TIGR01451 family)